MPTHPAQFQIGLVQTRCDADVATNVERAVAGIRQAAARGANIVCLPELFRTPYFCQAELHANFDLAEPVPGPSTAMLGQVAKELSVVVVASLFERRAAGVYHNTAAVIDADGALLGVYRKMHIPDDPLYLEKFYFAPGDLGFRAFDTRHGRIGVLVCWDQWYPEAARLTALQGASVLFIPTAIGWHPSEKAAYGDSQRSAWQTIQRAHAIANGVYVAAVNRTGWEPNPVAPGDRTTGLEFFGSSFVADPFGCMLAEAGTDEPQVLVAQCDLRLLETTRRHWPFLRDRRVDAFGDLTRRWIDA
ncbi:MAG TPA: carbon-nitrogen hydrolase [Polyangia bacterium]|jgi:N-carbamoylputrescine amidase